MFVGRGYTYPTALEGALKLKEVSYVHAEGYAAGELKHGPISLLDAECPLVAVATRSSVYDKLISNVMEGRARDATRHRGRDRGRRPDRALRRRRLLGARHARGAEPGPRGHPAPAVRLPRGGRPRHGRRPAAQPGQVGHGRVTRDARPPTRPTRPCRPARVPPGTTELGIDIIKVERIRRPLERFGTRFSNRVLTPAEQRYVRDRPETMAGRWAAKEAVSARSWGSASAASAGATSRSSGCRPGQPSVRLHGRAAARARAARHGADRACRSRHESDYAVAIAFGVRTAGGRYLFPPDIEERLDDRERRILARIERLRVAAEAGGAAALASDAPRCRRSTGPAMAERRPVGFGRRDAAPDGADDRPDGDEAPWPSGATSSTTTLAGRAAARAADARPQGLVREAARGRRLARLRGRRAARLPRRRPAGAGLVTLAVPESLQPLFAAKVVEATTMALPEDDVEEVDPEPALARILDHEHDALVVGPGLRPGLATAELVRELHRGAGRGRRAPPIVLDAEALRSLATMDEWWDGDHAAGVLTPHAGEFARLRAGSGRDPERRRRPGRRRRRPRAAATRCRDDAGARSSCSRARGRSIAAPDGTVAVAPFENPALATGGTGDVLAGRDRLAPRPGPRAVRRRAARASTCTARRARRSASGSATPACSPRTCPMRSRSPGDAWRPSPSARRGGKRLGFGARDGRRQRDPRRRRAGHARVSGDR